MKTDLIKDRTLLKVIYTQCDTQNKKGHIVDILRLLLFVRLPQKKPKNQSKCQKSSMESESSSVETVEIKR